MACMKLNKAIVFGCAGGSVGLAGLYLVNKSELSSFVMGGDGVTLNSIVLVSGAKAIPVDCYKNGTKVVDALRTLDGAAGMEQTVTITVYDKTSDGAAIKESLLSGNYVAFAKLKDGGNIKVAGLNTGLEVASMDGDTSAAGGFDTVTLKTPDNSRGDRNIVALPAVWTYLEANKLT